MKLMSGIFLLMCMPLAVAKSNEAYPKEKVAEFVVGKLDVTSIPSTIGPKREKGKRTFGDYGYVTSKLDENQALIEGPKTRIAINILEENKSGIYVCFNAQAQKQGSAQIQRVLLLKLKNGTGLLKGRESWKEFASCPVIGETDSAANASSGY